MSEKINNVIKSFVEFGFTKEQIEEIIALSQTDILEIIMSDFVDVVTDESILEEYATRLEASQTPQEKEEIISEICVLTYGAEAEQKKLDVVTVVLEDLLADATKMRDLYGKYQQGDPETVKAIDELQNMPEVKDLVEQLQAEA